jgi:hypothetical protein
MIAAIKSLVGRAVDRNIITFNIKLTANSAIITGQSINELIVKVFDKTSINIKVNADIKNICVVISTISLCLKNVGQNWLANLVGLISSSFTAM